MALGLTLGKQALAAKNRLIPMMDKSAWAQQLSPISPELIQSWSDELKAAMQEIKGDVSPPKGGGPPANAVAPKPL